MASYTALSLVNRVNLFRRQPTVTALNSDESAATLNALNMAIEDILGTRRWDFDLRHDGQLVTRAPKDVTLISWGTKGGTGVTIGSTDGFETADADGQYVVRVIPTADTEYANTPFRLDTYSSISSFLINGTMAVGAPKNANIGGGKLIYSEYVLPDTVREVIRVSYQEDELNLDLLSAGAEFAEWIPNNGIDEGEPQVMAIGGYDERTHLSTTDVAPQLRAIVWPVPDDEYVLNYSYYYRHPELSSATDVLEGVPAGVVNDIVAQATSFMSMVWDANFDMSYVGQMAQMQSTMKSRSLAGGATGRHTVRPWGTNGNRVTIAPGFPGKVIG